MMITRLRAAFTAALLFSFCLASGAALAVTDVAGVKFDDSAKVGGQDLKLNGAGIRYKAIFKVYAAGLYLSDKKLTVPDVQVATGARRVQIVMFRDVGNEEFGRGFMGGITQNTDRAEKSKFVNQLIKFGELFSTVPELKKGDVLTVDWIPAIGTAIMLNGKKIAEPIPDVGFYNAILRIWLGEKPVDSKLKRMMLGEVADDGPRSN
ncbi:hypothetical protein RCH09_001972 [Actimicrobium sp. GrIS 1.19]|uniref:chalcone isomerase family protein n=1 Tax=Actimicrobium sp. GrIS 1.19 TaxID=3071708 RepID=UPI002E0076A7|nr:hypothetical protein [Actimicrobium sp. GrIS 1.19]